DSEAIGLVADDESKHRLGEVAPPPRRRAERRCRDAVGFDRVGLPDRAVKLAGENERLDQADGSGRGDHRWSQLENAEGVVAGAWLWDQGGVCSRLCQE